MVVLHVLSVSARILQFVGLFIIHCTITPSMSMRLVVLQVFLLVWELWLLLGFGQVLVVLGLFRRNDELMDACMDGTNNTVMEFILRVRSFTVYHDDSSARLNASINSRVVRAHQIRGATKRFTSGTGCKARLPAEKKLAFSQQESARVHDETWAGFNESLRLTISQAKEIQPRCAVSVFSSCVLLFSLPSYLGQAVKLEE